MQWHWCSPSRALMPATFLIRFCFACITNISILCPSFSTILRNTYGVLIRLYYWGGRNIYSTEGVPLKPRSLVHCWPDYCRIFFFVADCPPNSGARLSYEQARIPRCSMFDVYGIMEGNYTMLFVDPLSVLIIPWFVIMGAYSCPPQWT